MPQILMPYTVHLDHTLRVTPMNTLFAKGDSDAHRFELTILRAGMPEDLTGCAVFGKFYRMADSTVVSVPGSVEDGKAVVVLDAACYDYIGRFALTIAIKKGEDKTTVFYGDGYMHGQRADTAISGEYIIYDIDTLLEKIAEIDAATQAANTATENANTAASNANTARDAANTAASTANTAANNANTAKDAANAAAGKLSAMTVSATPVETGTATAELSTVDGHYHLALGLPKGNTGATPQISVQVTTGAAGSEASVSVSGTAEEPVIHLTIPRGDVGDIGALTINGKTPDAGGTVTLGMGDIDGLSDAIANAGGVKTVAGVGPDSAGNVPLTAAEVGARPSSWTPTAADVGALPANGTAADSSKLGGKAPEYYLQPRNLLDNSDFRNPVNQKGQTSYIGSDQGLYTIDRWKIWGNTTLTVNDGYIEITDRAYQYFTPNTFKNTVHTFAAKRLDGTIITTTFNPNQEPTQDIYGNLLGSDAWTTMIGVTGGQYVWAALYEGSYTADTLPPYVPNGYAAELAACNSAPVDVGGGYGGGPLQAYPVGSIYVSATPTSPASLFGGTWEQMKDRFLLGAGDSYGAGSAGGESMHTLTREELPNYKIGDLAVMVPAVHGNWSNGGITSCSLGEASRTKPGIEDRSNNRIDSGTQYGWQIDSYGGGSAHNNMPPYLAVYMWKRVS